METGSAMADWCEKLIFRRNLTKNRSKKRRSHQHISLLIRSIGIIMANAQSFLSVLGLALQRYSHLQNAASDKPTPQYCQPYWVAGILMYVACQPLTVIALAYAPVSIIAPLGSLNIVYNAVICWVLIGETFRRRDTIATMVTFAAAVGVVVFGPKPAKTEQFPADRLLHFWDFPDIFLYVALTAAALATGISFVFNPRVGERKVYCFAVIVRVLLSF